jgi:ABC-type glycerol-3-phosphate transport system substrate-binding protein
MRSDRAFTRDPPRHRITSACSGRRRFDPGHETEWLAGQASKQPIKLPYALWDESSLPIVNGSFTDVTARNPGITVQAEIVPFDDHFTKLQREFAGGNAADVFHLNTAWASAFAFGKQLLPIEDRLAKDRSQLLRQANQEDRVPRLHPFGLAAGYQRCHA